MGKFFQTTALSFALVIGLAACGAQVNPKTNNVDASAKKPIGKVADKAPNPALWVVRDADTTVYLFGTVHVLKPEMKWQTEKFNQAFANSKVIYQEADISMEVQQSLAGILPQLAFYSDGTTLREVLEAEDENEVEEALAEFNIELPAVDRWKPWFVAINIAQLQMVKAGYQADKGVEMTITSMANEAGKNMRYLETAEQQLRILAGLPEESQIEFLVAGVEAYEETPEMLDELVEDWVTGDVAGIADLMSDKDAMGDQHVYDVMLTKRNKNWTRQIRNLMQDEPGTFMIAVGAAHLAGNDSVINMLEDQGETVVRQ